MPRSAMTLPPCPGCGVDRGLDEFDNHGADGKPLGRCVYCVPTCPSCRQPKDAEYFVIDPATGKPDGSPCAECQATRRACPECGELHKVGDYLGDDLGNPIGVCRECRRKRPAADPENVDWDQDKRRCVVCNKNKPHSEFPHDPVLIYNRSRVCRVCTGRGRAGTGGSPAPTKFESARPKSSDVHSNVVAGLKRQDARARSRDQ